MNSIPIIMEFTNRQKDRIKRLLRQGKNSEQIAVAMGLDKGSVAAYAASLTKAKELKKLTRKMLILECTSETQENKSESLLLKELTRIIGTSNEPKVISIKGKQPFIDQLNAMDESFVHISAHGKFRKGKRVCRTRIYFPSGKSVYADDIRKLWADRQGRKKPKLVLLSACQAGHQDLAEAFYEAGCRYFIAPEESVYWFDAALFLTVFYNLLLVENHTPWVAYKKADFGLNRIFPAITGKWRFYDKGKEVTYE